MLVGVSSLKLSFLTTNKGIKLMLAPESHSTFPVKPEKNSIFPKKAKTVISVENRKFFRSRMTKQTAPLNSSREISDLEKFRRIMRQSKYFTIFWVISRQ